MPYRPTPRRPIAIHLSALQLTGSIALGLWLGFIAIALTGWLVSRLFSASNWRRSLPRWNNWPSRR